MPSFVPPLPLPPSCTAPTFSASRTTTRVRMSAFNARVNNTRVRTIASIATTVGAVLTLFTTSTHALSPLSHTPSVAAVQRINTIQSNPSLSAGAAPPQLALINVSSTHHVAAHTEAHVSIGQKAANFLRARGLRDEAVVLIISALPVVELRGGIPVAFLLGVPPLQAFLLSVIGNMLPVIPLMWLLRLSLVQRIASRVLDRARRKAQAVSNSSSQARALALFVGVPLPGTGAWTGCLVAFVLGMPPQTTFLSLLFGVFSAAVIVTSLCAMGKTGGAIAASVLLATGLISLLNSYRVAPLPSPDTPIENDVTEQR